MKTDLSKVILRFTYILSSIMIVAAFFVLLITYQNVVEKERAANQQNIQLITKYLEKYDRALSSTATEIYKNTDFQKNLNAYYLSSTSEYMAAILSQDRSPTYLVDVLKNLVQDDEIKNISISIDYDKYLAAYAPSKNEKTSFIRPLAFISKDMPNASLILEVSLNSLKESLFYTHFDYSLSSGMDLTYLKGSRDLPDSQKIQTLAIGNHTLRVYEKPAYYLQTFLWLTLLIFLLMALFIFAINRLLKRSFKNYIQQYSEIITSLGNSAIGDYQYINIENKTGDLKEIASQINQFYNDNTEYQKTLYENDWLKQEAKYAALQHQIEPHFLFNNLEFIRMQAVLNDDDETSESIYLLSQLYRNNTYQPDIISLNEELTNIDLYLQLHQKRYQHNFQYKIDHQIKTLRLPKLSLQPFIENYIKHGFDSSKKENQLSIATTESENHYFLQIVDNGKGMDEAILAQVQQKLTRDITYSENIGISNSFRRIKHLFPGDTTFHIESQRSQGTSITIKIQKEDSPNVENRNCGR